MSGAQTSSFANVLFDPMMARRQTAADIENQYAPARNQLYLDAGTQQMARQNEVDSREHVAQVAGYILAQPEASRPTAYKAAVEWSRANGHPLPNAPAEYPGDQQMQMLQSMGIPAEQQYKIGMNRQANDAMLPPDGAPAAGGAAPAATPRVAYGAGGPGASLTVPAEYMPYIEEASKRTGVPVDRLIAQMRQESGFNPGATGAAGEIGLMQIKPSTATDPGFGMTGVRDPAVLRDPRTNINFGADYLKARAGGGDMADPAVWHRGLAAYNGGGDPNYVANVTRYLPAPGGGVAARTPGAVDVAGPGAPSMGAPSGGAPAVPTAPGPGQYTPEQMRRLRSMQANGVANQQLREEMDRFDVVNERAAEHAYQHERDAAAAARQAADDKRKADDKAKTDAEPLFHGQGTDIQDFHILRYSDPKSEEFHQAYARQANPKVGESGVMVYPNMSAYRMPQDADGAPITTYDQPRFAIGPGGVAELRKLETQASGLTASLDDFAATAKKAGAAERLATVAGASTDLRSAWTNAGLMAKGEALFNLGVLSGPDMSVIRGALADPSTFWGATASSETIDKQVGRIKRLLETRIDQARRSYGGGMSTGGAPAAGATAPAAKADRPALSSFGG